MKVKNDHRSSLLNWKINCDDHSFTFTRCNVSNRLKFGKITRKDLLCTKNVKKIVFLNKKVYTRGTFSAKMVYKRVRGWKTNLLISARPQRQNQCKRVPDLWRRGSVKIKRYYAKNGRLIPTTKRGKEIKRKWNKTNTIYLPRIFRFEKQTFYGD